MSGMQKRTIAGRSFSAVLLTLALSAMVPRATSLEVPNASIGFRTTQRGLILLDASINKWQGRTVLLDSGVGYPAILDRASADTMKLKHIKRSLLHLEGNATEAIDTTDWRKAKIQKGRVILASGDMPTMELIDFSQALGSKIDSIVGVPSLLKYVVKIDYTSKSISFYEPGEFKYSGSGEIFPLEYNASTHLLVIKVQATLADCSSIPVRLMIDTGNDADVMFNSSFYHSHPQLKGPDMDSRSLGFNGKENGFLISLQSIKIGTVSLEAPHVAVLRTDSTESEDHIADGMLGSGILSQFTIFVDKPENRVIFEPRTDRPPVLAKTCEYNPVAASKQ